MSETSPKLMRDIAKELEPTMQCNCDLDNWEPQQNSGHSWVCDIHKIATERYARQPRGRS